MIIKGDSMSKYYFIIYMSKRLGKQIFDSVVIDEHPFVWLKKNQPESSFQKVIINWKEISEDEFGLYNEIEYVDKFNQAITYNPNPLDLISNDSSEGLSG